MQYFKEMLLLGKWEDAENYLSRFTRIDGSMHSTKIFFEIRRQKYLEALDKVSFLFGKECLIVFI